MSSPVTQKTISRDTGHAAQHQRSPAQLGRKVANLTKPAAIHWLTDRWKKTRCSKPRWLKAGLSSLNEKLWPGVITRALTRAMSRESKIAPTLLALEKMRPAPPTIGKSLLRCGETERLLMARCADAPCTFCHSYGPIGSPMAQSAYNLPTRLM